MVCLACASFFQSQPQSFFFSEPITHQAREGVNSVINTLFGGSSANLVSLSAQGQWGVERGVITGNETAFKVSWNPKFYQRFRNPIDPKKKPKSQKTMPNRWRHKGKGGVGWGGGMREGAPPHSAGQVSFYAWKLFAALHVRGLIAIYERLKNEEYQIYKNFDIQRKF